MMKTEYNICGNKNNNQVDLNTEIIYEKFHKCVGI